MQNPNEFYDWLERQPADRAYGVGCGDCPVAMFMREAKGALRPVVSSRHYGDGVDSIPLPTWAYIFIRNWDDLGRCAARRTSEALELIRPSLGIKRTV